MNIKLKLSLLHFSIDFIIISLQIFSTIISLLVSFLFKLKKQVHIIIKISLFVNSSYIPSAKKIIN